jgi:hypothetical protein
MSEEIKVYLIDEVGVGHSPAFFTICFPDLFT